MFRFGVEWRVAVHELRGRDLASQDATSLCQVSGMVGDLEPRCAQEAGEASYAPWFGHLSRFRAEKSSVRFHIYHKAT